MINVRGTWYQEQNSKVIMVELPVPGPPLVVISAILYQFKSMAEHCSVADHLLST